MFRKPVTLVRLYAPTDRTSWLLLYAPTDRTSWLLNAPTDRTSWLLLYAPTDRTSWLLNAPTDRTSWLLYAPTDRTTWLLPIARLGFSEILAPQSLPKARGDPTMSCKMVVRHILHYDRSALFRPLVDQEMFIWFVCAVCGIIVFS